MKSKIILYLALVLSGGLFGCSTVYRQTKPEETSALPLYVHFGTDDNSLERLLSAQIHIGEPFFVGGDGYWELKGRIDRRNAKLVADLTGGTGTGSQFYQGDVVLEKPFFGQGGAFSGGVDLIWFVVSTNSDSHAILGRVDASLRLLGITNTPARHADAALLPSASNVPSQIDSITGLPTDPATGLPLHWPLDVRSALLLSAQKNQADFPNGQDIVLTHFSHVGQLVSSRGEIIYVADERAVTTNALSPHGDNFIVFFDEHFQFLGKINYVNSRPLWCDGGKLYLFGDLDGFPNGEKNYFHGNVIDVTDGFENLKIYHAKVYGSSGGLEDN